MHRTRHTPAGSAPAAVLSLVLALVAALVSGCGEIGDGGDEDPPRGLAEPSVRIDRLTGGSTTIAVADSFTAALKKLGLTAAVTGDARRSDEGAVVFPVTGGSLALHDEREVTPYVVGTVFHDGGLLLSSDRAEVELRELVIDPVSSRVHGDIAINDKTFARNVVILELGGSTEDPEVDDVAVTLVVDRVTLAEPAADVLRKVFKTAAVERGLLLGAATITVRRPEA